MNWHRSALGAVGVTVYFLFAFGSGAATAATLQPTALPGPFAHEQEPNGTTANATPISSGDRVRAPLGPGGGDVDFYSFDGQAGDRVYATTITAGGAHGGGASTDSQFTLLASDGTTVIEFDDDNGTNAPFSSSIAGAVLPTTSHYYLKVNDFNATAKELPYELYLQVRGGPPTAESEPNDTAATADALTGGFVSGARDPAAASEQDWYSMHLDAGDTVLLSLDLDPERDATTFNGRLGFGLVGDASDQVIRADDPGASETPNPTIPSEALTVTVRTSGTYYAVVDAAASAAGGPTATYALSANVMPAVQPSCRTYPATPGPITDVGTNTFAIPVADAALIDRAAVHLDLTHAKMIDLDVSMQAPAGNEIGLFTDIGSNTPGGGGQTKMNALFDQSASLPPGFTQNFLQPLMLQPEANYRLSWFEGQQAQGTWHLVVRDDTPGDAGTLNGAELVLCPKPSPPAPVDTIFSTDFEAGADGFTNTGTADEWELGLPNTAATATASPIAGLSNCGSGTSCWKTDLDNTYDINSSQDLLSPTISLVGKSGTIVASWQQWFQMESAMFDHMTVSVEEAGGANPRPLYTWLDGSMANPAIGTPLVNVPASSGWSLREADISEYAGKTIQLRFHLDTDSSVNYAGLAIDDVRVYRPTRSLTVTTAGAGSGFVDSAPSGIDCGTDLGTHPSCSSVFVVPLNTVLTAHPATGSEFGGFTGSGCSGAGLTCDIPMNSTKLVTATFNQTATGPPTGPTGPTGPSGPTGPGGPIGGPPSNQFTIGALKGAKLTLTVPGAGVVDVNDAAASKKALLLKHSSVTASKAGDVTVGLKLTKPAKKKLKQKGKVKVKAAITFTPTGGSAATQTKGLKVKKKKK